MPVCAQFKFNPSPKSSRKWTKLDVLTFCQHFFLSLGNCVTIPTIFHRNLPHYSIERRLFRSPARNERNWETSGDPDVIARNSRPVIRKLRKIEPLIGNFHLIQPTSSQQRWLIDSRHLLLLVPYFHRSSSLRTRNLRSYGLF